MGATHNLTGALLSMDNFLPNGATVATVRITTISAMLDYFHVGVNPNHRPSQDI